MRALAIRARAAWSVLRGQSWRNGAVLFFPSYARQTVATYDREIGRGVITHPNLRETIECLRDAIDDYDYIETKLKPAA